MSKKEKVLLFTDSFNSGGAQKQIVMLANGINEIKEFQVETLQYHDLNFFEKYLSKNIQRNKVLESNKILRILKLILFLKKYKPDYIISFLNGPNNYAALYKMFFFWRKTGLIVGERNLDIHKFGYKDFLIRFSHIFANKIVCNSNAQLNKLKPYFGDKLRFISNGTDVRGVKQKVFDKHIYESKKRKFIVSARVASQKNPLLLLKAINKLKDELDFTVHWYGDVYVNDPIVKQCKDFLDRNNLENHFKFQKSTNQIYNKIIEYDALILPSIYEGCPNAVIDAMICGLPVIASDVSDNRMYLNHQKEFIFTSSSVEELVLRIRKFHDLPFEKIAEIGKENIKKSYEFFDQKKMTQNYLELL